MQSNIISKDKRQVILDRVKTNVKSIKDDNSTRVPAGYIPTVWINSSTNSAWNSKSRHSYIFFTATDGGIARA